MSEGNVYQHHRDAPLWRVPNWLRERFRREARIEAFEEAAERFSDMCSKEGRADEYSVGRFDAFDDACETLEGMAKEEREKQ